jgi:RHS repeat-associated protein
VVLVGGTATQPYGFQGKRYGTYTGALRTLHVYDFRARAYDPLLGKFLHRDPAAYADGPDLYEAFRSNPLVYLDPSGKLVLEILIGAQLRMKDAASKLAALGFVRTIAEAFALRNQMINGMLAAASRMGNRGADFLERSWRLLAEMAAKGPNYLNSVSNYREAYEKLVYGVRGALSSDVWVHHVFPKAAKLYEWFVSRGVDPNNPFFLTE